MDKYNHKKVEAKWQKVWQSKKIFQAADFSKKKKKYILVEFPYPSGEGLHMGHLRPYVAADVYARHTRMKGNEVMFPIGWDAFGLPAENYAIKKGVQPAITTKKNIGNAKKQMLSWGLSFDWSREINTTDPNYYKWTQWLFLQFFKKGLAYEATGLINWCPKDKTGLANEEVIDGKCERCGTAVEKKELKQWYLKITAYAEKLLDGLKSLDKWPEAVKLQQENWIGKSTGAEIEFAIKNYELGIKIFTTRPDTIFGATYMVLAPEHPLVKDLESRIENFQEVRQYIEKARRESEIQRTSLEKEKTGVELKGIKAINPATKQEIYVWIADYVLWGYGTGAIMAVPAHDERDFKFANKFNLPVVPVIAPAVPQDPRQVATLDTYENYAERYIERTTRKAEGIFQDWIDKFLSIIDKQSVILELGSGRGLDADYIEGLGYKVERTDGAGSFIEYQKKLGKNISKLNLLVDDLPVNKFDLIFANKVLLHFQIDQFRIIAKKINYGLKTGAIFALSVMDSKGAREQFDKDKKMQSLRYFKHWDKAEMVEELKNQGFEILEVLEDKVSEYGHKNLLFTAKKKFVPVFSGNGKIINSSEFSGMKSQDAIPKMAAAFGKMTVQYKLRDWVFSRQRYWGEPIPLVYCERCAGKKKFVILHGWQETPDGRFYPWLKSELQAKGAEVFIPALPNSKNPSEREQVNFVLKNYKFDANTVLMGHSLGTAVALKVMEKLKINIAGLILVGGFANPRFKDHPRPFHKTFKWDFDFEVIRNKTDSIVVLHDPNDDAVSDDQANELAQALNVPVIRRAGNLPHFRSEREPEILTQSLKFITSKNAGWVPVPDKDLPVKLPPVKNYQPTGTGESPLAAIDSWANVKCPVCKSPAKRETNTMPQWAGSSWYWLRYADPENKKSFADIKKQKYWTPVDVYFGGMEHTTLHLLYSRFWNLFLHDQGLVTAPEPYIKRKPHGIILGPDGEKMSKSRGNVVNPQEIVDKYGADSLRMFELFLGPHEDTIAWNDKSVVGVKRFLDRVWNWVSEHSQPIDGLLKTADKSANYKDSDKIKRALHKLIKKITEDLENFRFNTAISAFMEFHNEVKDEPVSLRTTKIFLKLLYPFAPHLTEELNSIAGGKKSLQFDPWPEYNPNMVIDETVEIVVQINGRVKGKILVPRGTLEQAVKNQAMEIVGNQSIKRAIFVPNRLINFVV